MATSGATSLRSLLSLKGKDKSITTGKNDISSSLVPHPSPILFRNVSDSKCEKASVKSGGGSFFQRAASKWINRKIASQQRLTCLEKKALPPTESYLNEMKSGFSRITSTLKKKLMASEKVRPSTSSNPLVYPLVFNNGTSFPKEKGENDFPTQMQHHESLNSSSPGKKKKGKWKKIKTWLSSGAAASATFGSVTKSSNASVTQGFASSKPNSEPNFGGGNGNGNRFGGGGGDGNGDGAASNNGGSLTELISENKEENNESSSGPNLPFAFIGGPLSRPSPRTPSRQSSANDVESSSKDGDEEEEEEEEEEEGENENESDRESYSDGYQSMPDTEKDETEEDMESETEDEFTDADDQDFKEESSEGEVSKKDQASLAVQKLKDWMEGVVQSIKGFSLNKDKELEEQREKEAMAARTAKLVLRLLDFRTGEDAFAQRSEVSVLRRLQREAFSELLKLKERAEKLEAFTGIKPSASNQTNGLGLADLARTRLTGQVSASVALVGGPDDEKNLHSARTALDKAGMRSGLTTKFRFETPCRDTDLLVTECVSGLGEASSSVMLGGPITLQKVIYYASLAEGIMLKIAPTGARGSDLAEPLNPIQDEGLTKFASNGAPLLTKSQGSAIGLTLKSDVASFSASQFINGWGVTPDSDPENSALCTSSLLQLTLQPREFLKLAFSGLYRKWPAPPSPTSNAMHWSEMGPLVLPKLRLWPGSNLDQSSVGSLSEGSHNLFEDLFYGPGTSLQSLSLSGSLGLVGNAKLSGWVQAENADWLSEEDRSKMQWAVTLSRQTKQTLGLGWGVSLGSSRADVAGQVFPHEMEGSREASYGKPGPMPSPTQPIQAEAFLDLACGRGFKIQPGLVYAYDGKQSHNAIVLRSSWTM